MAGKSVRYWYARPVLASPWYQIAPRIGKPTSGAVIAFHSTVGLFGLPADAGAGR